MIISITGHTKGLGKYLHTFFSKEHSVIGISRTNGFDFRKDIDKVIETISQTDLFINNAYIDNYQNFLFDELKEKVGRIVCIGSQARKYPGIVGSDYSRNKQELYDKVEEHSSKIYANPCLHIDLGFMQLEKHDYDNPSKIKSQFFTTYEEVASAIVFWLENPKVKNIEFETKITDEVMDQLYNHNPDL
jgi:hypothetical protein